MRADKFFAEKYGSRTKAAEAIEKGLVLVNGKEIKPKHEVNEEDLITFVEAVETFVSNGGYKLDRAIKTFHLNCQNKVFVDIGASTGGFTDCLLQNDAKKVYAVDVGECLLHEKLRNDRRIVSMDNTNARYLTKDSFTETIDGVVTDVSFISLRLIFPVIQEILKEDGEAVVLIKPQFECEHKNIGKSGIVTPSAHASIVEKVLKFAETSSLYPFGIINAPVRKGKNIEYVLYIRKNAKSAKSHKEIIEEVKSFVRHNSLGELK